jgi:hypothetical protein
MSDVEDAAVPEAAAPADEVREVKIVVVGDGAVGKTCLCHVFVKKVFPMDYTPTIFENHTGILQMGDQVMYRVVQENLYTWHIYYTNVHMYAMSEWI